MADAVTSTILEQGNKYIVYKFTNVSDGTGESTAQKIDISSLTGKDGRTVTSLTFIKASWDIGGFTNVRMLFNHTADVVFLTMSGQGSLDLTTVGGFKDNGSGGNGDVLLTTQGHDVGDTYDITVKFKKNV